MTHYIKNTETYSFLSIIKNINTINWEDSIPMFHNLNSLIVIYQVKAKAKNTTKKIFIKNTSKKMRKSRRKYA